MSTPVSRRSFLGAAAAAGAASLVPGATVDATAPVEDPRVAQVIASSRDPKGGVHVERVAFVGSDGVTGTLPLSDEEVADLRAVLASKDFVPWQERGLRADGRKFFYVGFDVDGTVVHAVRRGEFLTLRVVGDEIAIATSGSDMAHGRAVEALWRYARGTNLLA